MNKLVLALVVGVPVLTGCDSNATQRLTAAQAFREGADQCLLAVRDRNQTYEQASECQALGRLSRAYIDAGGQLPNEPDNSRLAAAQGQATAWTARAVSATRNPSLTLW